MNWFDIYVHVLLALSFVPSLAVLLFFFWGWYQDYKAWKYQKNKPRILNPWSDW